jgi:hypothetical protein
MMQRDRSPGSSASHSSNLHGLVDLAQVAVRQREPALPGASA